MACDKCKQKQDLKKDLFNSPDLENNKMVFFVIIWFILGIYGLYRLFVDIYEKI